MLRVVVKGVLAHKLRFVLTALSIGLGVAFLSATLIYSATITRTFSDLVGDTTRGVDGFVRSTETASTAWGEQRVRIDESLVDDVRAVPGVAAVSPQVEGYAQVVAKDGRALGGFGPPTFGEGWAADDRLSAYGLVEGRAPGPGEVVLDRATMRNGPFALGDPVTVLTQQGPGTFTLVGAVRYGSADSPAGATLAFFDLPTAQQLVGEPGKVDGIAVGATEGVSQDELVERLRAALPADARVEAVTGDQIAREARDGLISGMAFFSSFLLVFALIALFVATFIIHNTFSILVAQRTRELALLRALGATRRQVTGSVLGEALVLGVAASVAGVAGGVVLAFGLKALLDLLGLNLPAAGLAVPVATIAVAALVGVGVTVVAALVPARRASRVAPMAALQAAGAEPRRGLGARTAFGVVATAVGVIAIAGPLLAGGSSGPVALGLMAVFVGVVALGPVLGRPLARVLRAPLARLGGEPGRLASDNAARNPRRTSATAAALMLGVTLVGTVTVLTASTKATIDGVIDQALRADLVIAPSGGFSGYGAVGFSPEVAGRVASLPEVATASPIRVGGVKVGDESLRIAAVDPTTLPHVLDLGHVNGDLAALGDDGLAVSAAAASAHGWQLGQQVPVGFSSEQTTPMRIVAVYERDQALTPEIISLAAADRGFRDRLDSQVLVRLRDGVTPEAGRRAVEQVTTGQPNLQLQDQTAFKAATTAGLDQLLAMVYALLLLSIVIAVVGIANTLALSIHERVHELGLLRALGMTRRQVRSTVRFESVIIALLGAVLGIVLGVGFGVAITLALDSQGISQLEVPVASLVVIAVLAALAGVVAALSPARHAARVDVLRAITTE